MPKLWHSCYLGSGPMKNCGANRKAQGVYSVSASVGRTDRVAGRNVYGLSKNIDVRATTVGVNLENEVILVVLQLEEDYPALSLSTRTL